MLPGVIFNTHNHTILDNVCYWWTRAMELYSRENLHRRTGEGGFLQIGGPKLNYISGEGMKIEEPIR